MQTIVFMDTILHDRIKEKMSQLENIKSYVTVPVILMIESPKEIIDIGNAFYFLSNRNLSDLDESSRLRIRSSDNSLTTSKIDFENLSFSKHECFRDYLEVSILNYAKFTPFKLEFLKVQPIYHDIN